MVLKHKLNDSYVFIDGIEFFTILEKNNPIQPTEMFVNIDRGSGKEGFDLKITGEAYLMNDKGQTIERLI